MMRRINKGIENIKRSGVSIKILSVTNSIRAFWPRYVRASIYQSLDLGGDRGRGMRRRF